jgi:hypothetical protein
MAEEKITTSGYVVLRARSFAGGKPREMVVARCVQQRPSRLDWDELAIKVNFRVPRAIFEQITPEATIDVPESFIVHPEIEVTVAEPDSD